MTTSLVQGVPSQILSLIQEGLIERQFYDGLYPNLAYRSEFEAEKWEGNTGTEVLMTRPGLLAPNVTPLVPGEEPTPKNVPFEQWTMRLDQYADAIDTNMVNSAVANSNLFIRNIHQLGLGAGQSINRIARNVFFKTYLSGQTNLTAQASSTATSVHVSSLNGFTDVLVPGGSQVRPVSVSSAYPLPCTFGTGSTAEVKNVIAAVPDSASDPYGPGTLTLSAGLTSTQVIRAACVSAYAPRVVRASGGTSIDAISPSDTLTLQQIINAAAVLRNARVQPHDDGTYHAHLPPLAQAQMYADPVFQKLNQSLPDSIAYKEGFIGQLSGVTFFGNVESPNLLNSGTLTATAAATGSSFSAKYGSEIGAEVVNGFGTTIGRVLITGKGAGYERYLDEAQYVTEAGTNGKIGEFDVVNDGMSILTERIRLVIRAPQDRLQQKVGAAWSITTGFACPSDITAPSGPERFKRALCLEFAM